MNESKSSASPVKPFYLDSLERESYEDGIELMKSSQEENILNISNLETSSEELIVSSKFSRFLANGRSVTKNFYESHKNEGLCNVSNNNISEFLESPKKSRSPEKIVSISVSKSLGVEKTPKVHYLLLIKQSCDNFQNLRLGS